MEKATIEKVLEALEGLQARAEALEEEAEGWDCETARAYGSKADGIREAISRVLEALGGEEAKGE